MSNQNERLRKMLEEARRWINAPDCPDWILFHKSSQREYRDTLLKQIDNILAEPICRCSTIEMIVDEYECQMGCPDCGHNYGGLPYCQGETERHR